MNTADAAAEAARDGGGLTWLFPTKRHHISLMGHSLRYWQNLNLIQCL